MTMKTDIKPSHIEAKRNDCEFILTATNDNVTKELSPMKGLEDRVAILTFSSKVRIVKPRGLRLPFPFCNKIH